MRVAPILALAAALGGVANAERPAGDTLAVQAKGAGIGAAVGGGIGLLAGYGLGGKDKTESALIGIGMGIVIGLPIGMQQTADAEGGTGHAWGTTLGTAIGFGAATAAIYGMRKQDDNAETIITGIIIVVACVSAGPIIGYRATQDHASESTPVMLSLPSVTF